MESTGEYWRVWHVVLEAAGLTVQLVNARSVKNVPGRAKTDKKDAVWLAKLTERGMLQPSFVPPYDIRRLREYTRLRADLVHDRTRQWARLEKLLERALIKVSAVASTLDTQSVRAMLEALIAGQRNPGALADLAIGRMRAKRKELAEALDGRFEDHHGELARILLDQIDALTRQISTPGRADQRAHYPDPRRLGRRRRRHHRAGRRPRPGRRRPARSRPAGRDHRLRDHRRRRDHRRDRPRHDRLRHPRPAGVLGETLPADPPVRQENHRRKAGKGNPWLNGILGEIAASAARTDTFLGERYRRLARRRGANARPWPPSPAPSSSSSTTCSPTPPPGSATSARLLRQPHQPRTQDQQPRPPAPGPRSHRHHRRSRLTPFTADLQTLTAAPARVLKPCPLRFRISGQFRGGKSGESDAKVVRSDGKMAGAAETDGKSAGEAGGAVSPGTGGLAGRPRRACPSSPGRFPSPSPRKACRSSPGRGRIPRPGPDGGPLACRSPGAGCPRPPP